MGRLSERGGFIFQSRAMRLGYFWIAVLSLMVLACSTDEKTLFTKIESDESGIDFVNVNHETERSNILTYEYFYNGGGVAVGDINNDGLVDVYFTSTMFENKLYLNKGGFKFEDITAQSGTACAIGWKTGVTMVDVNDDGWLDIYVCRSASPDPERRRNILLINNHDNTFTDRAKDYRLDDPSYSTQAAFFDFDRDNDLDVFLLNHSTLDISNSFLINPRNSTKRFPHVGNKLLRNEGGVFVDVSDTLGVYGPASNYGLGVSLSDLNNDGWIDIYAGCDYTGRDRLLFNEGGNGYVDATDRLSHISKFTMGTDAVDINGDGLIDLFTLDMLPEDNRRQKQLLGSDKYDVHNGMVRNGLHHQYMRNMLHLNLGNGAFAEVGQLAGVSNTDWSWGSLFADFDNDGMQDLFITNGFKRDLTDNDFAKFKAFEEMTVARRQGKQVSFLQVIQKFTENKIPNYMFKNTNGLAFENVTKDWGFLESSLANGVAYADLDNDGDLDLLTNNVNDPAGVYVNNSNRLLKNNFLTVKLAGKNGNKHAIGTRVTVYAQSKTLIREQLPVRGFQSSVDTRLHFGLGNMNVIDSMFVSWPDGGRQMFTNVAINRIMSIVQDGNSNKTPDDTEGFMRPSVNPVTQIHHENDFVDFRVQALLPRMYSKEGPAAAAADVNGDGFDDLFFGGAKGQGAQLWIGSASGFVNSKNQFIFLLGSETTDAVFFDADNDNDPDLYVVTGGYEFSKDDPALQDYLLINDGKGNFSERQLPKMFISGSCARAADIDHDGDQDLFIGGRIVPGRYPESPESVLLVNDGKGSFKIDENIPPSLRSAGMITDGLWADLDDDNFSELIIVGEWMPVMIFKNRAGVLEESTSSYISDDTHGFWNTIASMDFDNDGDQDFLLGNLGLNTQMRASKDKPVTLVYDDFDKNGSIDPILSYHIQGTAFPYPTRDELTEQLPSFKKRFNDYRTYSMATVDKVLTADELAQARKLSVTTLESCVLQNNKSNLSLVSLPFEMQVAPIRSFAFFDVDRDEIPEILTGGNFSGTRSRTGKMTGNLGFVLKRTDEGKWRFVPPLRTGIYVHGDVRKILILNGRLFYITNDGPIRSFERSPKVELTLATK